MKPTTKKILGGMALAASLLTSAQAVPLSTLLSGGSITAGDKLFDRWSLAFQDWSTGRVAVNAANIDISGLTDGADDPGPGLRMDFAGEMSVLGDGVYAYHDLTLAFRVSTIGDKKIDGLSLGFGAPASFLSWTADGLNDLGLFVLELVSDGSGAVLSQTSVDFSVLDDVETQIFAGSTSFAPQDEVFVRKNFLVWASDLTDTASLHGIDQRFSQTTVPEPASLALATLALLGAVGVGRRR